MSDPRGEVLGVPEEMTDAEWSALVDAIVRGGGTDDALEAGAGVAETDDDTTWLGAPTPAGVIEALDRPPGPDLATALACIDPSKLVPSHALAYLRAAERATAWMAALQATALVAIAGPRTTVVEYPVPGGTVVPVSDPDRSEIAAAMLWSEVGTDRRLTMARLLADPLPLTQRALASGHLDQGRAALIADGATRLHGYAAWDTTTIAGTAAGAAEQRRLAAAFVAACARLEAAVLPSVIYLTAAATRRAVARAVAKIDAEHVEARRRNERRRRDVIVRDEADGISTITAWLPTELAHACLAAVDRLARDPRLPLTPGTPASAGIGERRSEAFSYLILRGPGEADEAAGAFAHSPIRTHVDVVIDLPPLLGLAEEPAELAGGGPGAPVPVAAAVVRALIAQDGTATIRRLVADPLTGHLLDRGRTAYRVPADLRAFIATRDVTCRFPGCDHRAARSQIDHAVPWDDGGRTDADNLGVLCSRHHLLKTHRGWRLSESSADGSCRWQSPAGVAHAHPPRAVLPRADLPGAGPPRASRTRLAQAGTDPPF